MEIKRDILWRVYLSFIGVFLLGMIVLGRAFYIQQAQGKYWKAFSNNTHRKIIETEAERGSIYSEDGDMLSSSIPFFDIYMDFGAAGLREKKGKYFRKNIDSFCNSLVHLFKDQSIQQYKTALLNSYKRQDRFYLLKKNVDFETYKRFRTLPLVRQGRNRSGVIVEMKSRRLNPFGLLARRTIGLARENAQSVGLERTYDTVLKGTPGKELVRLISGGGRIPVEGYSVEPDDGKDLVVTIKMPMQDVVESALLRELVANEAEHGTCILMETKTGKIRAIANLGRNRQGNYEETYNYALQATEPGSTIKLATLLAVLDQGKITINDPVEVGSSGSAYVGVRPVTEAEIMPKPWLTVRECFAHSSNVGMSRIAYTTFAEHPDLYKAYFHRFHLDKKTGIDLLGEENPVLPVMRRNREGLHAMVTASFGYAIMVNPLHTLMLYNALANGGKMVKPFLVSGIRSKGTFVKSNEPTVIDESICKPQIVDAARKCMEAVVAEGTAKDAFKGISFGVAGKTGTAHVAQNRRYEGGVYQASFVGYFPSDNPQYTCIVVIRTKPHAAVHYGGTVAAPVFREIACKIYARYIGPPGNSIHKITPDSSEFSSSTAKKDLLTVLSEFKLPYRDSSGNSRWASLESNPYKIVIKSVSLDKKLMPDLRNMSLKDAVGILTALHINISVEGHGKIIAQSIAPGTLIADTKTITLLLQK